MERCYKFAGIELLVRIPDEIAYTDERRLADFAVTGVNDPEIFSVKQVSELPPPNGRIIAKQPDMVIYQENDCRQCYIGIGEGNWEKAYLSVSQEAKNHAISLKSEKSGVAIGTKTILDAMLVEHLIARNNGFIFHCSYIDVGGRAILFTAPSETGKSTQAELWAKHRGAEIINGDRAAVRMVDGVLMAEGIPFAGSSTYCKNRSLPILAIVYLGQAPVTTIRKMRGYEAFSRIWEGVSVNTWDRTDMELVSGVVKQVAESVPVFHMPCTPDESAVIALENALGKLVTV